MMKISERRIERWKLHKTDRVVDKLFVFLASLLKLNLGKIKHPRSNTFQAQFLKMIILE